MKIRYIGSMGGCFVADHWLERGKATDVPDEEARKVLEEYPTDFEKASKRVGKKEGGED